MWLARHSIQHNPMKELLIDGQIRWPDLTTFASISANVIAFKVAWQGKKQL